MKFTNEYIEMVSKAEEIQGLWKINEGNWFVYNGTNGKNEKLNPFCSTPANEIKPYMREYYSWLPTLEDLFGMVKAVFVVNDFYNLKMWIEQTMIKEKLVKSDIKEIVLDYVMGMVYEKHWNPDKHQWEAIE